MAQFCHHLGACVVDAKSRFEIYHLYRGLCCGGNTYHVPAEYNLHPDRVGKLKGLLAGGASFGISSGDPVGIDSIRYNGNILKLQHSDKKKESEKAAEQAVFDEAFTTAVLAIPTTNEATVFYSTKEGVGQVPLSDLSFQTLVTEETTYGTTEKIVSKSTTVTEPVSLKVGDALNLLDVDKRGKFIYLNADKEADIRSVAQATGKPTAIVKASVSKIKSNELEVPATWFLILNSLYIIIFAPLFSRWWESKYNPSASAKYGLGLVLLGIGFAALAFGSMGIEPGAKTAAVSMIWLILAYMFHTLGELCLSPVALAYISKLVPGRMIALMFGIWYIAIAIGNKLAGVLGGKIDAITAQYDMTTFFLIFTVVPIGLGAIGILVSPLVKKLMHGVH
ncbi:MAG: hypothetical protein R2795_17865 [Saprospiraceae bacterium]